MCTEGVAFKGGVTTAGVASVLSPRIQSLLRNSMSGDTRPSVPATLTRSGLPSPPLAILAPAMLARMTSRASLRA